MDLLLLSLSAVILVVVDIYLFYKVGKYLLYIKRSNR